MKKILMTSLVSAALVSTAHAGSISMDMRTDFESTTYNEAANKASYNRFYVPMLRLDSKANFDELTTFRLRFRLSKAQGSVNSRDQLNDATDFAYVARKLNSDLTLTVGKFATDIGGIEGTTSSPDLYLQSVTYSAQNPIRYATGAKLTYALAEGQELSLMSTNQQTDAEEGGKFNQTRDTLGVVYKGSFLDKTLSPILSYHNDKVQPSTSVTRQRDLAYTAVGFKYDFAPMFVEVDYLMDNLKSQTTVDETDTRSSLLATVGGKFADNWVGKLKYESSEVESFTAANTSSKTKTNAYQLAAEFQPTGDKNLRYHLAYVAKDTKPEAGETQTQQSIYAGVRLLADFLK